jgi:hypothetical protein
LVLNDRTRPCRPAEALDQGRERDDQAFGGFVLARASRDRLPRIKFQQPVFPPFLAVRILRLVTRQLITRQQYPYP